MFKDWELNNDRLNNYVIDTIQCWYLGKELDLQIEQGWKYKYTCTGTHTIAVTRKRSDIGFIEKI